jgi:hypothetical protein
VLARDVRELDPRPQSFSPLIAVREPLSTADYRNDAKSSNRRYKFRWTRNGALLGVAICAANFFVRWQGGTFKSWNTAGAIAQDMGYLTGGIVTCAFAGLILGIIREASQRRLARELKREVESERPHRFNNVLAQHWRGELPLWVSYWLFGFIGNVAAALVSFLAMATFRSESGYFPPAIFATMAVTWTGILLIAIWQVVGVWRAATRYAEERTRAGEAAFWGGAAQVAVAFGLLSVIGSFATTGAPQLAEMYRIVFYDDPGIPNYSIRVMRNGTEAEITGGFKYGLTDDFLKILKAARGIKVVHLDSVGGRLGEGERMFRLIRDHQLTTYVSAKCMSACTLAFAGGGERYLLKGALLGFHRGAFPGSQDSGFDSLQDDVFRSAGFDSWFIATALSTPNNDIWEPSVDILIKAKVITGVVDTTVFAASGFGANMTRERTARELIKTLPALQIVKDRFPERFNAMVDSYYGGFIKGQTEAEIDSGLRTAMLESVRAGLPFADDDVLLDFNKLLVDQYVALKAAAPSICWAYASGNDVDNVDRVLPPSLIKRELDLQTRILKTVTNRPKADPAAIKLLWAKVQAELVAKGIKDADITLIKADHVEKSKHSQYCNAVIMLYQEIGRLPRRDAALLVREIVGAW